MCEGGGTGRQEESSESEEYIALGTIVCWGGCRCAVRLYKRMGSGRASVWGGNKVGAGRSRGRLRVRNEYFALGTNVH